MEGSQALTSMDTKSLEVLSTSHGRGPLLFIAPRAKLAVTPSLGNGRDDRTLRSDRPDAGPQRPVTRYSPRVPCVQRSSSDPNGHLPTGRSTSTDRTLDPQRPVVSSKLPSMTGRVRSNAIGRSQRPVTLQLLRHRTSARPDAACQRPVHSDPASGQLTDASIFATNSFSLLTSSPLLQCANHKNLQPAQ